jgi:ketosteroid isomerase-like protein
VGRYAERVRSRLSVEGATNGYGCHARTSKETDVKNESAPHDGNDRASALRELGQGGDRRQLMRLFLEAFNRHDPEAVMEFFTDDCEFDTPRGPSPRGRMLRGKSEVREGVEARFKGLPDVRYEHDSHWACGDQGVSEWTLSGTTVEGERIEVRGCDLFQFEGDRIKRKDSFWKIVE